MDEKLRQLLDAMPERAPRSKLEPHVDIIRELRRKRRTYQEIATFFREHLQLSVAPSTIYEFVKARARMARKVPSVMAEWIAADAVSTPAPSPAEIPSQSVPDSANDTRERIRSLRRQPPPSNKEDPPRFEFDPQQPLTLQPKPKEK